MKKYKGGGKVRIQKAYKYNADDHEQVMEYAFIHANKYKETVDILPEIHKNDFQARDLLMPGHRNNKNAEYLIIKGELWELKSTVHGKKEV